MIVTVLLGQSIIMIDDEFFEVKIYDNENELKKNNAYIMSDSDIIYIYRGKYKDTDDIKLPGLYNNDGEIIRIEPNKSKRQLYSVDNVTELNIDRIFDLVEKNEEDFILPEDVEVINNNSDIFIPTIKDDDDFLKYLVKKIIIEKKINLKNYKNRFSNHYALTNMKSGLNKSTKMTVTNFKMWCEILGISWDITVKDNGEDKLNPLPETITISSEDF